MANSGVLRNGVNPSEQDLLNQSFDPLARTLVVQIVGSPDGVNYYTAKVAADGTLSGGSSTAPVYKTMYDFAADDSYIYTGEAPAGTATSAAAWRIQKVNFVSGNPTSKLYADGVATFTKVWDSRATYGYTS